MYLFFLMYLRVSCMHHMCLFVCSFIPSDTNESLLYTLFALPSHNFSWLSSVSARGDLPDSYFQPRCVYAIAYSAALLRQGAQYR